MVWNFGILGFFSALLVPAMNRAAFRRFEFFDVDTISEDISTVLVQLSALISAALLTFSPLRDATQPAP